MPVNFVSVFGVVLLTALFTFLIVSCDVKNFARALVSADVSVPIASACVTRLVTGFSLSSSVISKCFGVVDFDIPGSASRRNSFTGLSHLDYH